MRCGFLFWGVAGLVRTADGVVGVGGVAVGGLARDRTGLVVDGLFAGLVAGRRLLNGCPVGGRLLGGQPVGGRLLGGQPVGGRLLGGQPVGGRLGPPGGSL